MATLNPTNPIDVTDPGGTPDRHDVLGALRVLAPDVALQILQTNGVDDVVKLAPAQYKKVLTEAIDAILEGHARNVSVSLRPREVEQRNHADKIAALRESAKAFNALVPTFETGDIVQLRGDVTVPYRFTLGELMIVVQTGLDPAHYCTPEAGFTQNTLAVGFFDHDGDFLVFPVDPRFFKRWEGGSDVNDA